MMSWQRRSGRGLLSGSELKKRGKTNVAFVLTVAEKTGKTSTPSLSSVIFCSSAKRLTAKPKCKSFTRRESARHFQTLLRDLLSYWCEYIGGSVCHTLVSGSLCSDIILRSREGYNSNFVTFLRYYLRHRLTAGKSILFSLWNVRVCERTNKMLTFCIIPHILEGETILFSFSALHLTIFFTYDVP